MFDLLKRLAASVTGADLDASHVRFFAGEDGRPKLVDNTGALFDFVGPTGADGPQGLQGPQGPQGLQGTQGLQGPVGPAGNDGADSVVPGPQGPAGQAGATGGTGPTGSTGPAAFSTSSVAFTQPAVDSFGILAVVSSAGFASGQLVFLQGGGYYEANIQNPTALNVKNLGYPGSAAPGTVIAVGARVTAGGLIGPAGSAGAQGAVGPAGPTGDTGPAGMTPAVTRSAATASASTAVTTLISYPITAGEIVAGSEFEFFASIRLINTTTATNAVVTLAVGAANVLVLTQAIGTTAAATPGAPTQIYGRITFLSDTQAECIIHYARSAAVAANIILNTSAPITVSAAGATTLDLKFNTSGTTATFIARQASIKKVK